MKNRYCRRMGCSNYAVKDCSFCAECKIVVRRDKAKEYYQNNKDKYAASMKRFRENNPDYQKQWRAKNKEKLLSYKNKVKEVKEEEFIIIVPKVCKYEFCKNFVRQDLREYCCEECFRLQHNLDNIAWKKLNKDKWNAYQNERNKKLRKKDK